MSLIERIRSVGDRYEDLPFLIDASSGSTIRYGPAFAQAEGLARALRELGVNRGDRVCLLSESSVPLALTYLGVLFCGAAAVPISPTSSPAEVGHVVATVRPARLLVEPARVATASTLSSEFGVPTSVVGMDPEGLTLDGRVRRRRMSPMEGASATDVFSITFTSGSTALPKGVVHTIGSLFGNAEAFNSIVQLDPSHRFMHVLPMSYMAGLLNSLISPLMSGAAVVIGPAFSARSVLGFWEAPIRHAVTTFWVAPAMIAMLLRADRDRRAVDYCRRLVRRVFVGTAALAPETKRQFEAAYGVALSPSYGTSELLIVTINLPERSHRDDSVGIALPGMELVLRDVEGGVGEIGVRTPFHYSGYLGEPEVEVTLGAHFTGDLGTISSDGQLVVTGRRKELIICGGTNVSPLAVELVMERHPAIAACAAVGTPDEVLGETVTLAVVLRSPGTLEQVTRELEDHASRHLGPAQRPARYLEVSDLPRTETGKIRRSALRDLFAARAAS